MNADTRLPLEVNARPLDTATPIQQMGQQQNQNAMAAEQTLKAHYDALDAREKSRLQSTVIGATQLKTYLDNDDLDGAANFLNRRKKALHERMAYGENIDTQETDAALEMLRSGNVDELKNNVNGLLTAGQIYGIADYTGGGDTGRLIDRLKKENPGMTDMKALEAIKGGAGQAGRNAADINSGFDANYETQGGKNASDVETAGPKARNTALGSGGGDTIIKNNATLAALDDLSFSIDQAEQLLPIVEATGPISGRTGALAEDPDYKDLQGSINAITLQAKDLYNLGSGAGFTDADRDFLREVVAGKYARAETIGRGLRRFKLALSHRQRHLQKQNSQYSRGDYTYQQEPAEALPPVTDNAGQVLVGGTNPGMALPGANTGWSIKRKQ